MSTLDKIPFRFKEWFDVLIFLGIVFIVIGTTITIPTGFILNRSLFGLGSALIIMGVNEKAIYRKLPDDSGTSHGTWIERRRPNWLKWILDGLGAFLLLLSVVDIVSHLWPSWVVLTICFVLRLEITLPFLQGLTPANSDSLG